MTTTETVREALRRAVAQVERARLDKDIERREVQLAGNTRERRAALRAGASAATVEPHRNWHVYALGADLADCGLQGKDALALMGLRSLPVERFVQFLLTAHDAAPGSYLARLLPAIVDEHRDELHARGLAVSRQRRWVAYQAELESWEAQPDEVRSGAWRTRPMSLGQRELVRVTATLLDLPIPEDLDRGGAADWLDAQGANLNYTRSA